MPIDVLEAIANINYNTPRPRPIDAAVLFDLVKVRRLVDEATNLAVRAASDIASPILTNVNGGMPGYQSMNSLGMGGLGHGKLSKERKFRMREQASQKLARAYRLDEIACSVATMQGASTLDDIGPMVLERNRDDTDAKYVHFFHEKIPSRQLAESTSLEPLTEIILERPTEGEALRTRAMVKTLTRDHDGATHDLTLALQTYRTHQHGHGPPGEELQLQESRQARRRQQDIILAENEQPTSLEAQLVFQRATAYLALACQSVMAGLAKIPSEADQTETKPSDEDTLSTETKKPDPSEKDAELTEKAQADSRKLAKTYAKRALRDYMVFLSRFEYSPVVPIRVAEDFNERINYAAHSQKKPRTSDAIPQLEAYSIYSLSDLFAALPPSDLPPYPSEEPATSSPNTSPKTFECMTYHPLLTEALHSLLLCHCLVQTSSKELLRHANMVARLARLIDGYPIFQASRSPARSDWIEVLRRTENWLKLTSSWETLCASAPLPIFEDCVEHDAESAERAASAAAALISGEPAKTLSDADKKNLIRDPAILDALYDDTVQANDAPVEEDISRITNGVSAPTRTSRPQKRGPVMSADGKVHSQTVRWSIDEAEYPFISERAVAISRWIQEAPVVKGTRRKKRAKKSQKSDGLDDAMGQLGLEEAGESTKSG